MKKILSFDFGASSGRAMLGQLENGKIVMEEIHRFSNDPVVVRGRMSWDVLRLFFEIKAGITKALSCGGFDAISIDTWGVDFGLLDKNGNLLAAPVHYRDRRTEDIPEEVYKLVSQEELYERTGIQFAKFNTLYQLMAVKRDEPELLALADKMLMAPDLFAYFLTGEMYEEATIASTSNLLDPNTRDWDWDLIERLQLPKRIFAPVIEPGSRYGLLSDEICEELGCAKVPVIAVASHDTASAVVATPSESDDFAYISCGTWSLFGMESRNPIINTEAAAANFTNEGGFDKTIRFLKNISGLWLIQESRRQWKREGQDVSFDLLEKEALAAKPFQCFIDVDDPSFATAGNIPKRVCAFCEKTGQYVPQNRGEIMRCIYQSLAMKYKYTFETLGRLSGRAYSHINMLGGGIKDQLLCQMTADACGVEVFAGPTEATVMGNLAVALCAFGELGSLAEVRKTVFASTKMKQYAPQSAQAWQDAFDVYRAKAL